MSITDELREWFKDRFFMANGWQEIHAIADRIDAEHQKALDEWKAKHGQMWLKGYSECHAELLEGNETLASDLERCGWIRLPKDADGEYIHIGDVMDSRVDYLFDGKPFTVRALVLCEDGWEVADGRFGNRYEPDSLRHHHAPTVEDVLREFALAVCKDDALTIRKDVVDEYAAKLQLREDA